VKSRGYRIELGEIEAAMNTIDGVQECAVVAIQSDGFEGTTICCAYVSCPGVEVPPDTVRKRLAELLPHYMIPSRWVVLGEMPRNANGKADRPKLKEEFRLGREVVDLQAT
jgi:acyl-coenzyme A synthetase/AMP-(fatty) acid ligase